MPYSKEIYQKQCLSSVEWGLEGQTLVCLEKNCVPFQTHALITWCLIYKTSIKCQIRDVFSVTLLLDNLLR